MVFCRGVPVTGKSQQVVKYGCNNFGFSKQVANVGLKHLGGAHTINLTKCHNITNTNLKL